MAKERSSRTAKQDASQAGDASERRRRMGERESFSLSHRAPGRAAPPTSSRKQALRQRWAAFSWADQGLDGRTLALLAVLSAGCILWGQVVLDKLLTWQSAAG